MSADAASVARAEAPQASDAPSPPARLRRAFFDSAHGQLHVRSAYPGAPAAVRRPPLVMLHTGPQSSRVFASILPELGRDRDVHAPDYPGCGQSSPPPERLSLEAYVEVLLDWLDAAGLGEIDVLGHHTGSVMAVDMATRRPALVRRLVLIGLPVVSREEREALFQSTSGKPWPMPPQLDGAHLMEEWSRSVQWMGSGTPLDILTRGFLDKVENGARGGWAPRAALDYPFGERLAQMAQPVLGIGPRDDLWELSPRSEPLLRNGRFVRWPENGFNIFDMASGRLCAAVRDHLDG